MTPKQIQIRASDLTSRNKSPVVKAIYDRALKHAYEDQQKVLKKAGEVK